MPVNLTMTAQTGPARQVTAGTFTGGGILILPDRKILQMFQGGDTNTPPMKEFDLSTVTTLTCVISGPNYTITMS